MRVLAFSAFAWPLRLMLLLGPVTILLATIFAMEPSWIRVVAVTAAAGLVVAITFFSGVRVGAGNEAVSLALVPFWRFRLPYRRIASVAVETVRPFEDFGGWGIKGSHKKRGILLSAGEDRAVVFRLADGRTYLAAVGGSAESCAAHVESRLSHDE